MAMDAGEARRLVSQLVLHSAMLVALLWCSGTVIGYTVGYIDGRPYKIDINYEPFYILFNWSQWMILKSPNVGYFQIVQGWGYLKLRLIGAALTPFIIAFYPYYRFRDKIYQTDIFAQTESVYGDAHWAAEFEIKKAGLRSKKGMMLGTNRFGYFINEGYQHALLFAPTGSGKGVGFVIPNCLFWDQSMVVHDIKLENYDLTSGWRASIGQKCYVWEPTNPDGVSHCYNPLDWISNKPGQMVDDVQKIGSLILPKQDFWENEARSLFLGVVLYLIADPNKVTSFGEVVRTMRNDDVIYNFAVIMDTMGDIMHPVAYMNIASYLQKPDKERGSVGSTLNSALELWANPLIDATTARSDFNIMDLKKKKTTVYVGLTPDNINRLQRLMQIFYQQATEFLSRKVPDLKEEPYGVMFLMDEFPTLGKMEQFKSGIAYFRGYRVRLFLIIQDTQQLKGTYEEAGMNSFLSNSTFRITYAANNYETANLISQMCGNKTVEQISYSRGRFLPDLSGQNKNVNVSMVSRALLLPQEVILLPREEQIVLIESFPPIRSKKIFYYKDKFFTERLIPPVFVPTQEPYDPRKKEEAPSQEAGVEATTA